MLAPLGDIGELLGPRGTGRRSAAPRDGREDGHLVAVGQHGGARCPLTVHDERADAGDVRETLSVPLLEPVRKFTDRAAGQIRDFRGPRQLPESREEANPNHADQPSRADAFRRVIAGQGYCRRR